MLSQGVSIKGAYKWSRLFGHWTPGQVLGAAGVGELGWINTSLLPQRNFPES